MELHSIDLGSNPGGDANFNAPLAQSGEHRTVTAEVRGSKPLRCAKTFISLAQLELEHSATNRKVEGSSPSRDARMW